MTVTQLRPAPSTPAADDLMLFVEFDDMAFEDVMPAAAAITELVPPAPRTDDVEPDIQSRFEAFHAANPWVYARLRFLALDMVERGHQKISMKMLWEVLRWQVARATVHAPGDYALNNDFTSRFARLLATTEPKLANAFETRILRAA